MGRGCTLYFLGTVFSFITYVLPAVAEGRDDAALSSLYYQVQFASLIDSEAFSHHYRTLHMASRQQRLEAFDTIIIDLKHFWSDHGILTNYSRLESDADRYATAVAIEPIDASYLATSNRIRQLVWIQRQQAWDKLSLEQLIREGDTHSVIPEVGLRLQLLGDFDGYDPEKQVLTYHMAAAVKRFQLRHGLKQDGILGPETLKWLNVDPIVRAQLLASNFIRKTRFVGSLGSRFLLINIPAFSMVLVDDEEVLIKSKVIVGQPVRPTPMLSSKISSLVLNPSWNVPKGILRKDLLPKVREDGQYISKRNFDVFDYRGQSVVKTAQEWSDLAKGRFPYRLVQKPGEGNTLGRYKFYFENKFSVYLHDTADKHLFEESNRALSSGCIRIERVEALANWMASKLVKDKQTWVDMQASRSDTQWFALKDALDIHLVYWTAWVESDGSSQFRNDIYNVNSTTNAKPSVTTPLTAASQLPIN